ncbi:hypothetical protein, partial [Enterobacter hormaechei]|uniref:hypothetical protein n=2 Tax=Enterobacter cloacae complex TaxID=354276 RepID=UPI0019D026C7
GRILSTSVRLVKGCIAHFRLFADKTSKVTFLPTECTIIVQIYPEWGRSETVVPVSKKASVIGFPYFQPLSRDIHPLQKTGIHIAKPV